jgi:hypothetical protein
LADLVEVMFNRSIDVLCAKIFEFLLRSPPDIGMKTAVRVCRMAIARLVEVLVVVMVEDNSGVEIRFCEGTTSTCG